LVAANAIAPQDLSHTVASAHRGWIVSDPETTCAGDLNEREIAEYQIEPALRWKRESL
jgi:hypothetical protein